MASRVRYGVEYLPRDGSSAPGARPDAEQWLNAGEAAQRARRTRFGEAAALAVGKWALFNATQRDERLGKHCPAHAVPVNLHRDLDRVPGHGDANL